jgi:hypothetical protein
MGPQNAPFAPPAADRILPQIGFAPSVEFLCNTLHFKWGQRAGRKSRQFQSRDRTQFPKPLRRVSTIIIIITITIISPRLRPLLQNRAQL